MYKVSLCSLEVGWIRVSFGLTGSLRCPTFTSMAAVLLSVFSSWINSASSPLSSRMSLYLRSSSGDCSKGRVKVEKGSEGWSGCVEAVQFSACEEEHGEEETPAASVDCS